MATWWIVQYSLSYLLCFYYILKNDFLPYRSSLSWLGWDVDDSAPHFEEGAGEEALSLSLSLSLSLFLKWNI